MSTSYRNHPALNQSSLYNILGGIEHFKHKLDNPSKPSSEQILGSVVHTLILEPHNKQTILKKPESVCDGKTVEGKIWNFLCNGAKLDYFPLMKGKKRKQEKGLFYELDAEESFFLNKIYDEYQHYFKNQNDYLLINEDDYDTSQRMTESVLRNNDCVQRLKECLYFEKEYYFEYQDIKCKSKLDGVGKDFVLDLKTTSLHPKLFNYYNEADSRQLYYKLLDYGYFFQAYFYLLAFNSGFIENTFQLLQETFDDLLHKTYYMIFVRSEPPYAVYPLEIRWKHILDGKSQVELAMYLYKQTLENNPQFIPQNRLKLL